MKYTGTNIGLLAARNTSKSTTIYVQEHLEEHNYSENETENIAYAFVALIGMWHGCNQQTLNLAEEVFLCAKLTRWKGNFMWNYNGRIYIVNDSVSEVVGSNGIKELELRGHEYEMVYSLTVYFTGYTEVAINKKEYREMNDGDSITFTSLGRDENKELYSIKWLNGSPFYVEGVINYYKHW